MARVDLDELERKASASIAEDAFWFRDENGIEWNSVEFPAARAHVAANDPTTTLALIARIRELEAALGETAGAFESTSDTRRRSEYADELRTLLAKGVVTP